MIDLEPAMIYRLDVAGPAEATDGSASSSRRQYWQMIRATLEGRSTHATTIMPASTGVLPIQTARPPARAARVSHR